MFDRVRETRCISLVPVPIAFLDEPALADVALVELASLVTPYMIPHIAKFLGS